MTKKDRAQAMLEYLLVTTLIAFAVFLALGRRVEGKNYLEQTQIQAESVFNKGVGAIKGASY